MGKDPAIPWYFNDWYGGTITFTRHIKGCYMDVLHAQFNIGHLSLDEIKTVLGADFGNSWPTLSKKFMKDDKELYYNERLEQEITKRKAYNESRRKNLQSSHMGKDIQPHMKKHMGEHMQSHMGVHMEPHMDNENDNEKKKEEKERVQGEKKPKVDKYPPDSPYYQEAVELWEIVQARFPKDREPNLQAWADDIRKIYEIDKRDKADIKLIFKKLCTDSEWFWVKNIRSPGALRGSCDDGSDRFGRMLSDAQQNGNGRQRTEPKPKTPYEPEKIPTFQPNNTRSKAWESVMEIMQTKVSKENLITWIKPLKLIEERAGEFILLCSSKYHRDWVVSHFIDEIEKSLETCISNFISVKIVIGELEEANHAG